MATRKGYVGNSMVDGGGPCRIHEEQPEIVSRLLTSFLHPDRLTRDGTQQV